MDISNKTVLSFVYNFDDSGLNGGDYETKQFLAECLSYDQYRKAIIDNPIYDKSYIKKFLTKGEKTVQKVKDKGKKTGKKVKTKGKSLLKKAKESKVGKKVVKRYKEEKQGIK